MEPFELKNPASPAGQLVKFFGDCVFSFLDHEGLHDFEVELRNPTDEFPEGSEAYTIFTHYASLYDDEDFSMILDSAESLSEMTNDQGRIETQVLHNAVTLRDGWVDWSPSDFVK